MPNHQDINEKIIQNNKISLVAGAIDSANFSTMFSFFSTKNLMFFLQTTLKFALFPLAALLSGVEMVLSWREAMLNGKTRSISKAMVNTTVFFAVTAAVVGALFFSGAYAAAAPYIFSIVFGAKALYHFGAAAWYGVKSMQYEATKSSRSNVDESLVEKTNRKKQEFREIAKNNFFSGVIGSIGTAAVSIVMAAGITMLGSVPLSIIGIAAGVLGLGYVGFNAYKMITAPKAKIEKSNINIETQDPEEVIVNGNQLRNNFRNSNNFQKNNHSNNNNDHHNNNKNHSNDNKQISTSNIIRRSLSNSETNLVKSSVQTLSRSSSDPQLQIQNNKQSEQSQVDNTQAQKEKQQTQGLQLLGKRKAHKSQLSDSVNEQALCRRRKSI